MGAAARPLLSGVAAAGRYRLCLHVAQDRLALHRLVAYATLDTLVGQARAAQDADPGTAGTKKGARLEEERRTNNMLSFFQNVSPSTT